MWRVSISLKTLRLAFLQSQTPFSLPSLKWRGLHFMNVHVRVNKLNFALSI